jgi:hypothetical protein
MVTTPGFRPKSADLVWHRSRNTANGRAEARKRDDGMDSTTSLSLQITTRVRPRSAVTGMPQNLDPEQLKVLTAFAQTVLGAQGLTNAQALPGLIDEIDDFITDLSPSARDDVIRGLNYLGSDLFMGFLRIVTGGDVEFESFDELDPHERRQFLDALERSDDADMRALYLSLTGLVTTVYFSARSRVETGDPRSVPDTPHPTIE